MKTTGAEHPPFSVRDIREAPGRRAYVRRLDRPSPSCEGEQQGKEEKDKLIIGYITTKNYQDMEIISNKSLHKST